MNVTNNPATFAGLTAADLHDNLVKLRQQTGDSIQTSLQMLETVNSTGVLPGQSGVTQLAPPKGLMNVSDLAVRIGLLQDALNQLMQETSKNEIQGRLKELNQENRDKLDHLKDQMKHVQESVKKNQEAAKKVNIFQAIANFFKALFNIIAAVFTAIAAVGEALVNPAGAAGLFVAATAMFAAAAVDIVLAIDATIQAAGGHGFLSDADKERMNKAVEILGYVALGASMLGGLGGLIMGVQAGVEAAGNALVKVGIEEGSAAVENAALREGASTAMMELTQGAESSLAPEITDSVNSILEGVEKPSQELIDKVTVEVLEANAKKALQEAEEFAGGKAAQESLNDVAAKAVQDLQKEVMRQTLKSYMQPITEMTQRQAVASGAVQGASSIIEGVGGVVVAGIQRDAAGEKRLADEEEAKAKAVDAMMQALHKLIDQLEKDLEKMLDSAMDAVSSIFNAVDESADSMKNLMHFSPA